jgi:dihydrodipicolinate reductase
MKKAKARRLQHSRGGTIGGIPIHSVRLAGYLAHQEVIFGMAGQTLSIRHDTITRECYMPGVLRAVKACAWARGLDLRIGEDSVSKKKVAVIGATGNSGTTVFSGAAEPPRF